jgi:hypothetical protein
VCNHEGSFFSQIGAGAASPEGSDDDMDWDTPVPNDMPGPEQALQPLPLYTDPDHHRKKMQYSTQKPGKAWEDESASDSEGQSSVSLWSSSSVCDESAVGETVRVQHHCCFVGSGYGQDCIHGEYTHQKHIMSMRSDYAESKHARVAGQY